MQRYDTSKELAEVHCAVPKGAARSLTCGPHIAQRISYLKQYRRNWLLGSLHVVAIVLAQSQAQLCKSMQQQRVYHHMVKRIGQESGTFAEAAEPVGVARGLQRGHADSWHMIGQRRAGCAFWQCLLWPDLKLLAGCSVEPVWHVHPVDNHSDQQDCSFLVCQDM